jgi:hypothetical protein
VPFPSELVLVVAVSGYLAEKTGAAADDYNRASHAAAETAAVLGCATLGDACRLYGTGSACPGGEDKGSGSNVGSGGGENGNAVLALLVSRLEQSRRERTNSAAREAALSERVRAEARAEVAAEAAARELCKAEARAVAIARIDLKRRAQPSGIQPSGIQPSGSRPSGSPLGSSPGSTVAAWRTAHVSAAGDGDTEAFDGSAEADHALGKGADATTAPSTPPNPRRLAVLAREESAKNRSASRRPATESRDDLTSAAAHVSLGRELPLEDGAASAAAADSEAGSASVAARAAAAAAAAKVRRLSQFMIESHVVVPALADAFERNDGLSIATFAALSQVDRLVLVLYLSLSVSFSLRSLSVGCLNNSEIPY